MAALDDNIIEYIREGFIPYKSGMLISITNNIEDINQIPNIDVYYNFPYVNSFMTDLITEDSLEVETDNKLIDMELNFKKTFIAYLESFGILLNDDIVDEVGLNFYNEAIIALKNIYTLSKDELEDILRELDNQDDSNTVIMANILAEHCNLSSSDFFSLLEDISDEALENLRDTIEKIIANQDQDIEVDDSIPEDIQSIIMDPEQGKLFLPCKIVQRYITEDYRPHDFVDGIKDVYTYLNELTAEEILSYGLYNVIFLLLITTSKDDYLDTINASLNLELVEPLNNDQKLNDEFMKKLYDYLKIRGV